MRVPKLESTSAETDECLRVGASVAVSHALLLLTTVTHVSLRFPRAWRFCVMLGLGDRALPSGNGNRRRWDRATTAPRRLTSRRYCAQAAQDNTPSLGRWLQ